MQKIVLEAQLRDPKLAANVLRRQNKVPAIYYGHKVKNMALQIDYQALRKAFGAAGRNQIVELHIDSEVKPVLVHDVQYHPLTDRFSHVDFLHVNMDEEVNSVIPVIIRGIAPAVKNFGGILTTLKHEIKVRCLPADLPPFIEVDVAQLEQLHSAIHVCDLFIPTGVKLHEIADEVVITVTPPKVEEEKSVETALPVGGVPLVGAEEKAAAEAEAAAAEGEKKAQK